MINKKLKVMILHNIISPYRLPLFEELSKKYDLTVYFCKAKDKDRKWSADLSKYSFKYKILPHKDFGPFVINPTLKKELIKKNFDVHIIVENPENAFSILNIMKYSKKRNKRIILWNERINNDILSIRSFQESRNLFKRIFYSFVKKIYKKYRSNLYFKSDYLISFSNQSTKVLILSNVDKSKIFETNQIMPEQLLSNPTWSTKPKELKNKKIILSMGYLNKEKGVNYLIEAFNKLNRRDMVLLISGTGNQEEKLKELARDNKNIIFLGYSEGIEKANYYSMADLFVFPTLHDCWGLVVNEAFYYGVPIISTNKAGAIELIEEGKTGFIIPDKDPDALANKIEILLNNPKLFTKIKENIKKIPKSKTVNIHTTVKTFEKAINCSLGRKR